MFGISLYIPFKVFGTNLLTGRSFILLLSIAILLIAFSKNPYYLGLSVFVFIIVLFHYHIFHFFHFCLSEILSISLIFLSIVVLVESSITNNYSLKQNFISALLISLSYYLKIQFVYAIVLIPCIISFFIVVEKKKRSLLKKQLFGNTFFLILFLTAYTIFWYIPNRELFDYVLKDQTANRFANIYRFVPHLKFLVKELFLDEYLNY